MTSGAALAVAAGGIETKDFRRGQGAIEYLDFIQHAIEVIIAVSAGTTV